MEPYNLKIQSDKESPAQVLGSIGYKPESTIDEPAMQTLMRDLKGIGIKMRYVLLLLPRYQKQATNQLKHWDLWGPLLICLSFSISLALASNRDGIQNFINVFMIYWIGGLIISVNLKLLGAKSSIFQNLSTVGYCLLPLGIFGVLVSALHRVLPIWLKIIIIIIALLWSTIGCIMVNSVLVDPERKTLSGYPIFLFYIFLAWYSIVV